MTMQSLLFGTWGKLCSTVLFSASDMEEALLLIQRHSAITRSPARVIATIDLHQWIYGWRHREIMRT